MTKFVSTVLIFIFGLAAVGAVGPRIAQVIGAAVPLVLVAGVLVAVLRLVWWYTR